MELAEASPATLEELALVAELVRRDALYVDLGGAWVSPEVLVEGGRIVLDASRCEALDESD